MEGATMPSPRKAKTKIPPLDRLITFERACELTGLDRRTIERWGTSGRITIYRLGPRRVRLDVDEIAAQVTVRPDTGPDAA
jgi:excisionase family DNA binding protein